MRQYRVWAAALLGAAALLAAPATSSAQVSIGLGRYGISFGTPYYYSPYYSYGYYPSLGYYSGYSYYPSYGSYGYYPSRWGYSNTPSYYGSGSNWAYPSYNYSAYPSSDYYSTPATSNGYYAPANAGSSYAYGASSQQGANTARLNVRLPAADAEVWFDDKPTQQRGTMREFASPPLNPDKNYTYEVRARWMENGKTMERTKKVAVRANGVATVDFTTTDNNSRVDEIDRDRRGKEVDRDRPRTNNQRLDEIDRDRDRPGKDVDRDRPKTDNPRPSDTRPPDRP
jgi:uncharacterized protein (TIGR03000 family)